jgi:hypothetical protein
MVSTNHSQSSLNNLNILDEDAVKKAITDKNGEPCTEQEVIDSLSRFLLSLGDQDKQEFNRNLKINLKVLASNSLKLLTGKVDLKTTWKDQSIDIDINRKETLQKMLDEGDFSSVEEVLARLNTYFSNPSSDSKSALFLGLAYPIGLFLLILGFVYQPMQRTTIDTPPSIPTTGSTPKCPQDSNIVAIACEIPVVDNDNNFDKGKLTARFKNIVTDEDRILIYNNKDQENVFLHDKIIGQYKGGIGILPLEITFNSSLNIEDIKTIMSNLVYQNVGELPTGDRILELQLIEGDGKASNVFTQVVSIQKVNNPPIIVIPPQGKNTDEDKPVPTGGISITDSDMNTNIIKVDLKVNHGTLRVKNNIPNGLTDRNISNNQTASVTVSGNPNQINNTLKLAESIIYQNNQDYNGSDSLTITAEDSGEKVSGIEGKIIYPPDALIPKSDVKTISITIKHINHPPVLGTQVTQEQAITLIKNWLEKGKNEAFGSNYNRQIVTEYTTGEYQNKMLGKIDSLINKEKAYDVYSSTLLTPVKLLTLEGNQAKIDLEVSQSVTRYTYKNSSPIIDPQNSKPSRAKFTFVLQQVGNGNWKIADVKQI